MVQIVSTVITKPQGVKLEITVRSVSVCLEKVKLL